MTVHIYLKHYPASGEPLIGGTAKAVHGFAMGLAKSGVDITILCEGDMSAVTSSTDNVRVWCFAHSARSLPFTVSPDLRAYVRRVAERRAGDDLFVLNGMFHPSLYRLSRLLLRYNLPYVVAPHLPYSKPVFSKSPYLKWPYWHIFEHRLLQQAAAVQVLNPDHVTPLRQRRVTTPFIVTPNGFNPSDISPLPAPAWRRDTMDLLAFSRIDAHHKGLDLLLTAFDHIHREAPVTLTIQGPDDGDRASLERRASRLTSADRITFRNPDFITPPTEIIGRYDAFCLPSRYEGFGLAALESMLAGRVLLVSQVDGIAPHVVASDCGVVVTPTVDSVRDGLRALIARRPAWPEMGRAGRRYALDRLSWESIAAAARSKYSALAKGKALQER